MKSIKIDASATELKNFARENNLPGTSKAEILDQNKDLIKEGVLYAELDNTSNDPTGGPNTGVASAVKEALDKGAEMYSVQKPGTEKEPFASNLPDGSHRVQVAAKVADDGKVHTIYNKGNATALGAAIINNTIARTWLSISDATSIIKLGNIVQPELGRHKQPDYAVFEAVVEFLGGRPVIGQFGA